MLKASLYFVLLCLAGAACAPEKKCGGPRYYDPSNVSCRDCPKDSTFRDGTCVCKHEYEFANNRCVLRDASVRESPDASSSEAGMSSAASPDASSGEAGMSSADCGEYCNFVKVCVGDNALGQGAIPDVIAGLHADDTSACVSNCVANTAANGSTDPVVACIEAGRKAAACAGDSTQAGLFGAITLIGDCCKRQAGNALCTSICKVLTANALVKSQIDFCD
jgi:hypothetical protein